MMRNLIQTKCPLLLTLVLVYAVTLLMGCTHQSYGSPEGYDMKKPEKMELGKVLNEISGICYYNEDNSLLAISDSKRNVFEINLKKKKLKDFTDKVVDPDADIEDLVKTDSALYLLGSKGILYQVPVGEKDTQSTRAYSLPLQGPNDFETIYYDPNVNSLIILCKNCTLDKGHQQRSAFRFNLENHQFDSTAFYTISTADVKKVLKDDNAKFDPSAAAIHPINKRLYILASAGNLLVIADTHGKVIEAYNLDPELHPQAEGIAFAPDGDMYITNEGKYGKATLQIFHYQKSRNKK